eukprot:1763257-Prymnesium_polylepis.1
MPSHVLVVGQSRTCGPAYILASSARQGPTRPRVCAELLVDFLPRPRRIKFGVPIRRIPKRKLGTECRYEEFQKGK